MRKIAILFILTLVSALLVGCYNERIERIEKKVTKLEDDILRIQDRLDSGEGASSGKKVDRAKLLEALQRLKKLAEKKSYSDDPQGKPGEGGLDLKAMARKSVMEGNADKFLGGVTVEVNGKKVGVTKETEGIIVRGIPVGMKTVVFKKEGYKDFNMGQIDVREKQIKMVTGLMEKK